MNFQQIVEEVKESLEDETLPYRVKYTRDSIVAGNNTKITIENLNHNYYSIKVFRLNDDRLYLNKMSSRAYLVLNIEYYIKTWPRIFNILSMLDKMSGWISLTYSFKAETPIEVVFGLIGLKLKIHVDNLTTIEQPCGKTTILKDKKVYSHLLSLIKPLVLDNRKNLLGKELIISSEQDNFVNTVIDIVDQESYSILAFTR